MDARAFFGLLVVAMLSAVSVSTTGAPLSATTTREFRLVVTELPDGSLAFNGQVPGPTLDVHVGDTLVVTLENALEDADVSFHVHGATVLADMDGIAAHPGTALSASFAPPGGSFTYTLRASHPGTWHYHDHVLGPDGAQGTERGLYGVLLVRDAGEARPDAVLDLHMLDAGANGGRGLDATFPLGHDVELALVGTGDHLWNVTLRDPSGAMVGATTLAPGISERFLIEDGRAGTYAWRARSEYSFVTNTGGVRFQ